MPSQSVPKIDKNAPLAFEEQTKLREETHLEKGGKRLFIIGAIFSALIFIATWVVFGLWIK